MRLEHKILIDFINNRFKAPDIENLNQENWEMVVSEASRHRIAPLVYNNIKQSGAESLIPDSVVQKFREKYLGNAYRNTVLFHQLDELVASLNEKKIPVILLKGAHLAEFVYRDISLRPMSDIDIMVKEEHLTEAVQVAFEMGYHLMSDHIREKKSNKNVHYAIAPDVKHFETLCHTKTKCVIEIHCSIASEVSPFRISPSELWQNSQQTSLNKKQVFLLSPEDMIIHLSLHASYDDMFGYGLGALYDIAITIQYYNNRIDWKKLWRRSVQWRTNKCLCVSLYFAKQWFQINFPAEMLEKFRINKMVRIAEERVFRASKIVDHHFIPKRIRIKLREMIRHVKGRAASFSNFVPDGKRQLKPSRFLFNNYFSNLYQAIIEIFNIIRIALHREQFFYPIIKGDNDVLLRKWLTKL
jgi:hypothetical protein